MQTWVDGRSRFGERVEDQGRPAGPIHQAPRPAAPAPCPGSCHLLGRKDGKSKGSSLCRHLETRLPKHSGGGAVGEGPGEGHQAHEWRRSEHVPTRTVPGGQGPGCPETPGTGGPAWGSSREGAPALAGSVCASVLVLSVRGRRAFSASRGGRRWRDLPSVCGGAPACGLGCAHSHGGGRGEWGDSSPVTQLHCHGWHSTSGSPQRVGALGRARGRPSPSSSSSSRVSAPELTSRRCLASGPSETRGRRGARPFCSSLALHAMQQGPLGTRGAGRGAGGCPGGAGGLGPAPPRLPGRGAPASSRTGAACPCRSGAS